MAPFGLLALLASSHVASRTLPPMVRPHLRVMHRSPALVMDADAEGGSVAGFCKDRAAGLLVAGSIGAVAELTATRVPIALSPLLYATAFGIAIGNTLRIFDPELKSMSSTTIGMKFAKQRLLRAGIILYGAKSKRRSALEAWNVSVCVPLC